LGEAIQTTDLGYLALTQGNYLEAEKFYQKSLKIFKRAGAKSWIFEILRFLGTTYRGLNQYKQAEQCYKECIHYAEAIGKDYATSIMFLGLSFIALNTNDLANAESWLSNSLYISKKFSESFHSYSFYTPKKFGATGRIVLCIAGFASLAVKKKRPKLAARFFGAYFAHYKEFCNNIFISSVTHNDIDQYINRCREQLSDDEFECAWNAGSNLSLDATVEELIAMTS
jgi:tetratricopeptide (TPR) repeat protein